MSTLNKDAFQPILKEGEEPKNTRLVGLELENGLNRDFGNETFEYNINFFTVGRDKRSHKNQDTSSWDEAHKALKDLENVAGWGQDGGGLEIMTQPYSINILKEGGDENLRKLFELIGKYFHPITSSGTHINISKLPTDSKQTTSNLWWLSVFFGPQLQKIFGRRTSWAQLPQNCCRIKDTTPAAVDAFRTIAGRKPTFEAYFSLKSRFIAEKSNRYEFRGAKATTDIEEALAWVELASNMMEAAASGRVEGITLGSLLEGPHLTKYIAENCNSGERTITRKEMELVASKTMHIRTRDSQECRVFEQN